MVTSRAAQVGSNNHLVEGCWCTMSSTPPSAHHPHFCRHCGAALPPANPRFCIECGGDVARDAPPTTEHDRAAEANGPTVRLPNARVAQQVIGGTIRLPTSGAIPPGLWFLDHPPAADDVVAVYAPLRAIVGGWSGLAGAGWRQCEQPSRASGARMTFCFETVREWFPAEGCGAGLRLQVQLAAQAEADEGHTRRGFRYRVSHDPPMEIAAAWWLDPASGLRTDRSLPQIQIMAPPRVGRVSDYDEPIVTMPAGDAEAWSGEGKVHGLFRLLNPSQQRTPAGRGLPLAEVGALWRTLHWLGQGDSLYRVQAFHPLVCRWASWGKLRDRMQTDARGLGLDLGTDLVMEWWLDREGHDCVVLEEAGSHYGHQRVVIAFRRSQIAACERPS
jgi:hypothetical protein